MSPDHLGEYVPLTPAGSSSDVHDANMSGYEKNLGYERSFDTQPYEQEGIPRRRGRFRLGAFVRKLIGWPAVVICGQMILQSAAWGLFGVVQSQGFIALPHPAAGWVRNNPHVITLVFTQISTILSAISSILFSWGLYQSITLHLHGDGMPLAKFLSFVKISSRSLLLNPRKLKWSLMSATVFILTGFQTTGWSGLLTPQMYDVVTPLTGYELDLANPRLQQVNNSGLNFCVANGTNLNAFLVGQTESGYAALKGGLELPGSLTLMDQTFNVSTAGILPLNLVDIDATSWFPGNGTTELSATVQSALVLPKDISGHYSLIQQGFTADVDCKFQDLSADTTPTLLFEDSAVKDWTTGISYDVTLSQMSSECSVPVLPGTQTVINATMALAAGADPNAILMIACAEPAGNYTIIIAGSGPRYSFMRTTVCTFAPQITQVRVDYSDANPFSGIINSTTLTERVPDNGGLAGFTAVNTIYNMQMFSQATWTNIMGDELISILQDISGDDSFRDEDVLWATGEYIRGVAEYSGSVLRACLSANNGAFLHGVPTNMSTPTSGHLHREIAGWLHVSTSTFWELIPGTFIAIMTIGTVLVVVAHHAGDPESEPFDPSDAMHLVSVSAAGGLAGVFKGTKEHDLEAVENVHIGLGEIPGRGLALKVRGTR
ncbi:hypothetical protein DFH06DRAFT_1205694 [Mycena polygramma]|nr:hypothetical protein DFH06DRAFT_1205694 [Mycena polygramma]